MTTITTLAQAIAARDATRTKLAAAIEATARARTLATTAQSEVDRLAALDRAATTKHAERLESWTREGGSGTPPVLLTDASHLHAAASAGATLDVALANVARFENAENAARSELAAADATVHSAARDAVRAEVRADFAELERVNARRAELRERLFAAYLADQAALPDALWLRVDTDGGYSAQALSVGLPMVGTSIYSPDAFGGDVRPSRARIDRASALYEERVARLCETPASAAKDEAA
jgi:hypothetical protein